MMTLSLARSGGARLAWLGAFIAAGALSSLRLRLRGAFRRLRGGRGADQFARRAR